MSLFESGHSNGQVSVRNLHNIRRLLGSLARSVGQPAKLTEIEKDIGGDRGPVASETLYNYLDALDRLMLTEVNEAWRPYMRSRTRLRSAPVRYFVDPSLGPAALGIGSAELMTDLEGAVCHFEAMAIRTRGGRRASRRTGCTRRDHKHRLRGTPARRSPRHPDHRTRALTSARSDGPKSRRQTYELDSRQTYEIT
jgi:hypothetical protein